MTNRVDLVGDSSQQRDDAKRTLWLGNFHRPHRLEYRGSLLRKVVGDKNE